MNGYELVKEKLKELGLRLENFNIRVYVNKVDENTLRYVGEIAGQDVSVYVDVPIEKKESEEEVEES